MILYLDIDGVLIDADAGACAKGAVELIEYVTDEFDCCWLSRHCKGDAAEAVGYLSRYFSAEVVGKLRTVRPVCWEELRTEGIDFDRKFIWLVGSPSEAEVEVLKCFGASGSLCLVDLKNEGELADVLAFLKGIKAKRMKRRLTVAYTLLVLVLSVVIGKAAWMGICNRNVGTFESEKTDILNRRNYLIEKVIVEPEKLLAEMPAAVGPQFQGEWALYSASMLSAALTNIAEIYPETSEGAARHIDSLIKIVMSPEIRRYDAERWGEDPLETLDGDESHISYLSHLAWMISGYKQVGGDGRYDKLYCRLCETMDRRIRRSPCLNLQTYPGEYIYVPDMLVAIVALANYSRQNGGEYWPTVHTWLEEMQSNWIDEETGLIMSFLPDGKVWIDVPPPKGSYSALSCYYLTFVDEVFALEQYRKLKEHFYQNRPVAGFKEYYDRKCLLGFDIDAGPILFNLSPSGTAFGIGAATYFGYYEVRKSLLKTGELAGFTVSSKERRHYLLANVALVGEAITLAMRTAVKWE